MGRKVYIYPAESYLGCSLGESLAARGFQVLGGYAGPEAPAFLSAAYQVGSHGSAAAIRQFLAIADVVIYELHGHEHAARDAVVHMAKQPFGGRQQLFIGVSTPLVWAATRPGPSEEPIDIPDSASELAAAGGAMEPDLHATGGTDSRPTSTASSAAARQRAGDVYAIAAAAGALSDRDASRRAPCLRVREVHELEQLVVRCQRKGKLRTAVVCPGLLYGQGEADDILHPIMRKAWELNEPLHVYGNGTNHLPTIHVDDCAAYISALCGSSIAAADAPLLAGLPDKMQYLLAVDCPAPGQAGGAPQGQLIQQIAEKLGTGDVTQVPSEQLLFTPGVEQWTLNTPLFCTPLPAGADYSPQYSLGLLHHLDTVIQQWRTKRHVTPLRIVLSGPPMAGKSVVAAKLASLYGLPLYTAKDLLAAVDKLPAEEAKAVTAELSGKEPRASSRSMAALFKAVVSSNKVAVNRGYVLDAFPKTLAQAKWAFTTTAPMTPDELAEAEKDEASSRSQSPSKTTKGGAAPPPKKDAKSKGGALGADGPEVPLGQKLAPDAAYAPTHLITIKAASEQLAGRRVVVEQLEQEASRAATPQDTGGKPAAKGGAKGAAAPGSHNNDKDYARRAAAWSQILADEQADLEAQVTAVQARWDRQQAEKQAERERAETEARTLRARRRRAREAAAAAAAAGGVPDDLQDGGQVGSSPGDLQGATLAAGLDLGETGASSLGGGGEELPAEPEGPVLPKYGGMPGLVVGQCGAQYLELDNPDISSGPPVNPLSWEPAEVESEGGGELLGLQQHVTQFLGAPHNFEGFNLGRSETDLDARSQMSTRAGMSTLQRATGDVMSEETFKQYQQAAQTQAARSLQAKEAPVSQPLQAYIMSNVMQSVTEALRIMCANRPTEPLRFLAHHLLAEADKVDSQYVDPYTDGAYEAQRLKHREKQARDEARALAAQQKAERELAAKQAAKQAEGTGSLPVSRRGSMSGGTLFTATGTSGSRRFAV